MPNAPASLSALLDGLVDYAGLFPPAALPLDAAAAQYAEHRAGADRRALGRFVAPAARLDAIAAAATALGATAAAPWPVSALVGDGAAELAAVLPHLPASPTRTGIAVDAMEARAATLDDVALIAARVPPDVAAYVEIPIDGDPRALVAALGAAGLRAKVRTGGLTPDAFPSAAALARFVLACRDAGVPFKATAGLHHPLRGDHALTYAADAERATMYGFLNVFVSALLAHDGADAATIERALLETDRTAFAFDDAGLAWRGARVATDRVREARRTFATSFGSCSFDEPTRELRALVP